MKRTAPAPKAAPPQQNQTEKTAPWLDPEAVPPGGWLADCIGYLRLSDARSENDSFTDREAKLRERAWHLRWRVLRVVIENDVINGIGGQRSAQASAFKKRRIRKVDGTVEWAVWRPGFRSVLDALNAGQAQALLAEDLDRTLRDPRDCEDFIDVCERRRCNADSLSGSLKFTDGGADAEITMARLMVTIANKESRDRARRVASARERQAQNGTYGGGRRPYGFGLPAVKGDGKVYLDCRQVVPEEAAVIVWAAERVLTEDEAARGRPGAPRHPNLGAITRDLNTPGVKIGGVVYPDGVPTATGTRWTAQAVRDVLLRPRNAGHTVYRSEAARARSRNTDDPAEKLPAHYTKKDIIEGALGGEPILAPDVWQAVVDKLTDPSRVMRRGPANRWLGSGIYCCPCGVTVEIQKGTNKAPAYRKGKGCTCAQGVKRNAAAVDDEVERRIVKRLSRPDAVQLLDAPAGAGVNLNKLRAERRTLQERKAGLAAAYADGDIDKAQLVAGTKRLAKRIADLDAKLRPHTDRSPLVSLVGPGVDVAAAWQALPLGTRREVVKKLLRVTILPTTQRGRGFDPTSVRIEPLR